MRPTNYNELIAQVIQWGNEKRITGPLGTGTVLKQLEKTQEELIETRDAALEWMLATNKDNEYAAMMDFVDGIGDIMVTIILAADMMGVSIDDCLHSAYTEIAGRTGTMVDGMFVKDMPSVVSREMIDDDDIDWSDLEPSKACTLGDETCESCQ
jgi:hypothetical protein